MANMMDILASVPPALAVAWTIWFVVGGVLAMWYRHAGAEIAVAPAPMPAPRPVSRAKSASRPPSGMSRAVAPEPPAEPAPVDAYDPPPGLAPVIARDKKPVVIGDPFGDLATLLDQAAAAAPSSNRAPADSPILSSSGTPMRRTDDDPNI
jgi:hypothetical protein